MIGRLKDIARRLIFRVNVGKALWFLAQRLKYKVMLLLYSDEEYAKRTHIRRTGEHLDLDSPSRFNEKLWWLNLNNRDPLLTMCADKYKVRDYVAQRGLGHILNELYGVYDHPNDIDFDNLPSPAFIKTNHGSGWNALYDRGKPFDYKGFLITFNSALKMNYYNKSREWCYKNIEPKILVERVLIQKPFLVDWKFLCFDGKVKLVLVDIDVAAADGSHNPYARRNVYDRDFRRLNIKIGREHFDETLVVKPSNFEQMLEYAEILAEPFPHCRVDLYNIDGRVIFGEITFYHGGAGQVITPKQWDETMGSWIDLKSDKIVRRSKA